MSKSQNNKKAAVLALLGVTALGAYAISGTYAKYISEKNADDKAQVAKWGFTVNGKDLTSESFTFDLFTPGSVYNYTTTCDTTDDALVKNGATDDAIIAPGTCGEFSLVLKNTSEVKAAYAIDYTVTNANNIPIEFSVDGGTTWASTLTDVDYSAATSINYDDTTGKTVTVKWRWVYENGTDTTLATNDASDTALGTAGAATVTVDAKVTAKQLNVNIPE